MLLMLNKLLFFQNFSRHEKVQVLNKGSAFYALSAGETVIKEGDEGDHAFYIIMTGAAEIFKGEQRLTSLAPGDFFGEVSFLSSTARVSTVKTMTTCILFRVDAELLKTFSAEMREKIKDNIISKLLERLDMSSGRISLLETKLQKLSQGKN